MKTLIIFNTIVNVILIGYILYRENRFYIQVNRSFWYRKLISITLMWNYGPIRKGIHARRIFTIRVRSYGKTEKWDSEMFHSGEYLKYRKD